MPDGIRPLRLVMVRASVDAHREPPLAVGVEVKAVVARRMRRLVEALLRSVGSDPDHGELVRLFGSQLVYNVIGEIEIILTRDVEIGSKVTQG